MAKKTVASLQKDEKRRIKFIKMVRSEKTGAYTFEEKMMSSEEYEKENNEDV